MVKWMINKNRTMAKCPNCKFTLRDKDEIRLLGTFIAGYRYCPYCGKLLVEEDNK